MVKNFKPTTPGVRGAILADFSEITTNKPHKALLSDLKHCAGRNNQGKISVRHRGGGNRAHYRMVDFKRDKDNIPARVVSIEYDPKRSARIALLSYKDGEKRYIICPQGLKVNDVVMNGAEAEVKLGNCLPLQKIPAGTIVHNIELCAGKGAQIARSAGTSAQLLAKEANYAVLRLSSGEQRLIRAECRATVGQVGNLDHRNVKLGKAGRSRWKGIRPTVRGSVMNPCDHPHGGGEAKCPVGHPHPCTPAGKPALGLKTRRRKKLSSKLIIRRRK